MLFQGTFHAVIASNGSLYSRLPLLLGLHIPDGLLSLPVSFIGWATAATFIAVSLRQMVLLHIAGFRFDIDSRKATFWQTLTPRNRVLCAALLVGAIAFTPNAYW